MAKRYAPMHAAVLQSHMPPTQICKDKTIHTRAESGPLKYVNHLLIRKTNKTPSTSLAKKEMEKEIILLCTLLFVYQIQVA